MLFSSVPAFAEESPESMTIEGRVFTLNRAAGSEPNTAILENNNLATPKSHRILGSDVAMYISPTGHKGSVYYSAGLIETTAPCFTARAEIWSNGRSIRAGKSYQNKADAFWGVHVASYQKQSLVFSMLGEYR